jgi:predicted nucleic-acid-binding protein
VIAVDTNVLVRLLTGDDAAQADRAARCIRDAEVLVLETVVLETVWVLTSAYSFSRSEISAALRRLLGLPNVRVSDASRLAKALEWFDGGLDFADALHLAGCQGATDFVTFDREMLRRATDVGTCRVAEPPE